MNFEPINNEDYFAWIAPDGTVQVATIGPDKETCLAFSKMLSNKGLSKSPATMMREGYRIDRIHLTVTRHENQQWT